MPSCCWNIYPEAYPCFQLLEMPENVQSEQQSSQRPWWQFKPGQSGNPAGKQSVAAHRATVLAKAHKLAEPLGGFENLNAIEQTLIERAADLALTRPRRHDERVRTANIVNRILRDVLRRHGPVPAKAGSDLGPSLSSLIRQARP